VKEEKICMDKEHHHTHLVMLKHSYLACFTKTKNHSKEEQRKAYPCNKKKLLLNLKYVPLKITHVSPRETIINNKLYI